MGDLSIDPLGDTWGDFSHESAGARLESWIHQLRDLAEEVRDDPDLAAALARQIRSAEEQLAALTREGLDFYRPSFTRGLCINPWG